MDNLTGNDHLGAASDPVVSQSSSQSSDPPSQSLVHESSSSFHKSSVMDSSLGMNVLIDLTGDDDLGAASGPGLSQSPPQSSDPPSQSSSQSPDPPSQSSSKNSNPPSQSSSQSSNSGGCWIDNVTKKDYPWLIGGHPMRSRKRPRPYGPEQLNEEPDNTPLFGSYMSSANGRKLFTEVENDLKATKMRRLDGRQKSETPNPEKPKAKTPKPKAPPKPRRAAKGKKTAAAPAPVVENTEEELVQTRNSTEPSPSEIQETLSREASIVSSETFVSTSTSDNTLVDDHDSLIEGDLDENENVASNLVPPIPNDAEEENIDEVAAAMEAALEAGIELELASNLVPPTSNKTVVDDHDDHDSLFEGDLNENENVAFNFVPPVSNDAEEEAVKEMAAAIEAEFEAEIDAELAPVPFPSILDCNKEQTVEEMVAEMKANFEAKIASEGGTMEDIVAEIKAALELGIEGEVAPISFPGW